jgi:hypothetical protein
MESREENSYWDCLGDFHEGTNCMDELCVGDDFGWVSDSPLSIGEEDGIK